MADALKYMIDESGERTSVLVPIKKWEKMNADYRLLQNKLRILTGISDSLEEIKQAKKTGKKLQSLKDFLRESNG